MPTFLRRAPELTEALLDKSPQGIKMTIAVAAIFNAGFQSIFSAPPDKGRCLVFYNNIIPSGFRNLGI